MKRFECTFMCNCLFMSSFEKRLFKYFPLTFNQYVFLPSIYRIFVCLFILDTSPLLDNYLASIFFTDCGLSVYFLNGIFDEQKILKFDEVQFIYFVSLQFVLFVKAVPAKGQRYSLVFPSRSFMVLCFTFISMIHLELTFVYVMRLGLRLIFFHMDIQLFQHHLFWIVLSQLNCLGTFVENQVTVYIWSSSRLFCSTVYLYIFMPVLQS